MSRTALAAVLALVAAVPALAQDDHGVRVSATASAVNVDSTTAFGFGASGGYQFSRFATLEVEVTTAPRLEVPINLSPVTVLTSAASFFQFSSLGGTSFHTAPGRAVIFTTNIRTELPTNSRLVPFFVAGGGTANVRREADFSIPLPALPPGVPISTLRPITQHIKTSATDLALTIGGGLDVQITSRVAVGADIRYFHLLGESDENLGRFGAGVRYKF